MRCGRHRKRHAHRRRSAREGVAHCGGGSGPQPQGLFDAVVDWVENDQAPDEILASRPLANGEVRTRPLCPYPAVAEWTGAGSTDDAANFVCTRADCDD